MLFCGTEGFGPLFGEPELGWRELMSSALEVVVVPGDHHGVMVGVGARLIAARLNGGAIQR